MPAQVGWVSFWPSRPGVKRASRGEIVEFALHVLSLLPQPAQPAAQRLTRPLAVVTADGT